MTSSLRPMSHYRGRWSGAWSAPVICRSRSSCQEGLRGGGGKMWIGQSANGLRNKKPPDPARGRRFGIQCMESVAETKSSFKSPPVIHGDICAVARAVVAGGCSIIPINPETKRPFDKWKQYQSEIADAATLNKWLTPRLAACAAVCGKVSGGLCILDFDVPDFYHRWLEAVGNLADGLPTQQTGGGGYQVAIRFQYPSGNEPLAWTLDEEEKSGRKIAIETRGEGGYADLPGSRHPEGTFYKTL